MSADVPVTELGAPPFATRAGVRRAVGAAVAAPSVHNTQPWRFRRVDDATMEVYADLDRLLIATAYEKADDSIGYRCPAEPVDVHVRKGRPAEETTGRRCLCNGLLAAIGLGRHRADGYTEPPLLTLGQDTGFLADLPDDHSAADVVAHILLDAHL